MQKGKKMKKSELKCIMINLKPVANRKVLEYQREKIHFIQRGKKHKTL